MLVHCRVPPALSSQLLVEGGTMRVNPLHPMAKSALIDFTLSNARRFYSPQGDPLGLKGLKNYPP